MIAEHDGYAVEWDGDFKFGVASHDSFKVEKNVVAPTRAVGAAFLSGYTHGLVVHMDDDGSCEFFKVRGSCVEPIRATIEDIPRDANWTLCGPGVANPKLVAEKCRLASAYSVSVCPLLRPLAAFGHLVGALTLQNKITPRKTRFCEPRTDFARGTVQEFDDKLDGDGLGRMAHVVQTKIPVVNQMMRTPCIPAFYDRVISTGRCWGKPIFLMLAHTALEYFPTEPLAIRNYAATNVPVEVENTESFAKASGCEDQDVTIFVASELTPGLGSFLRFHHVMCGENFVVSSDPKAFPAIPESIPLFRWAGAYNIDKEQFKEVVLNET